MTTSSTCDTTTTTVGSRSISARPTGGAPAARRRRSPRREALRLLYVALTRARHQCSLVWGGFTTAKESSLGHFLAPPGVDTREDASMLRDLESLARESGGTIAVRTLALDESAFRAAARRGTISSSLASSGHALDGSWRTASFTAFVAGERRMSASAREGIDVDEVDGRRRRSRGEHGRNPAAGRTSRPALAPGRFSTRSSRTSTSGAATGPSSAASSRSVWRASASIRLGRSRSSVRSELCSKRPSPQGSSDLRLADVPLERRSSEMEFTLPLGTEDPRSRLRPASLAAVFAAHPSAAVPSRYAQRVADLGFHEVAGYLRGYVDLVFEHAGRFFLVDWKSNFLGTAVDDYRRDRLAGAMASHHYILQYHLYTAMLDRYLRGRSVALRLRAALRRCPLHLPARCRRPGATARPASSSIARPFDASRRLSRLIHDPAETIR